MQRLCPASVYTDGRRLESTLFEFYGGGLYDEAAVEAAVASVPAPRSPEVLLAKLCALGVSP